MDRGALQAIVHAVAESDRTEHVQRWEDEGGNTHTLEVSLLRSVSFSISLMKHKIVLKKSIHGRHRSKHFL